MTWNRLGIRFHSFDHTNYADFNSTTEAAGTVEFTLPQGDYRFRADFDGVQFWSGDVDHCTIPGGEAATIALPAVLAAFTTEQPGNRGTSDLVRIDPDDEQYIVNLHLSDFPIVPGSTYTINVMIYGRQLMMTAFTVKDRPGPLR